MGALGLYKANSYKNLKGEIKKAEEEIKTSKDVAEKRLIKNDLARNKLELFSRRKTLYKIGSAAAFSISCQTICIPNELPIYLVFFIPLLSDFILIYKLCVFFDLKNQTKALKKRIETETNSKEKDFLKYEIRKIEKELRERKKNIITMAIMDLAIHALFIWWKTGNMQQFQRSLDIGFDGVSLRPPDPNFSSVENVRLGASNLQYVQVGTVLTDLGETPITVVPINNTTTLGGPQIGTSV